MKLPAKAAALILVIILGSFLGWKAVSQQSSGEDRYPPQGDPRYDMPPTGSCNRTR